MIETVVPAAALRSRSTVVDHRVALAAVLLLALCVRANFATRLWWEAPYDVHNIDEAFLPYEALATWEGVTPRELGWPASTTRVMLSGAYAADMIASTPAAFLTRRPSPARVMDALVSWTRTRLDDPAPLYAIGRWLSVIIGVLQVLAAYWAGSRWGTRTTGLVAAVMCALAPLAIRYSQFVLADMTGVLFTTLLAGLIAPRTHAPAPTWVWAGIALGAAAASKYHLALWVFPALIAFGLRRERGVLAQCAGVLVLAAAVHLLLVPWTWTNPLLILKEFAATVVSKVGAGSSGPAAAAHNVTLALSGFGVLVLAGLIPGAIAIWRDLRWRSAPLVVGICVGLAIIASAAEVYDRYGLLVFPAVVMIAATGIAGLLTADRARTRRAALAAVLILLAVTVVQVARSQAVTGRADSYVRAHAWLMTHMRPGDRLAVDSLYPQHLPRTREQLARILGDVAAPTAYAKKVTGNGFTTSPPGEPMRQAILNDELYAAHWAQRELSGRAEGTGFDVTLHSEGVHFNSVPTHDALEQFLRGLDDPAQGYDALLLRHEPARGLTPDVVFAAGQEPALYLYLRPRGSVARAR